MLHPAPCPPPPPRRARGWLAELRRLWRRGLSAARVAARLSSTFAPDSWSRAAVYYWCRQLGLKPHGHDKGVRGRELAAWRLTRWRQHMARLGLTVLLPWQEKDQPDWTAAPALAAVGLEPAELPSRESDVLALLYRAGPLTRSQIAAGLGLAGPGSLAHDPAGPDLLRRHRRRSYVVLCGTAAGRGGPELWDVNPALRPLLSPARHQGRGKADELL